MSGKRFFLILSFDTNILVITFILCSVLNRNKYLGEESLEDDNKDDDITENKESENEGKYKKTFTPQYVNIRRQRPSTTEGPSTSKYMEIKRSTTETNQDESNEAYSK